MLAVFFSRAGLALPLAILVPAVVGGLLVGVLEAMGAGYLSSA